MSIIYGFLFGILFSIGSCGLLPKYTTIHLAYKDIIKKFEPRLSSLTLKSSNDLYSKVIFYLYSKGSDSYELLSLGDDDLLKQSSFNISKPTKIIIHGWMDYVHGEMITTLKSGFLTGPEDVNLLAVDWGDISIDLNYVAAAMKTEEVGKYVAEMVDFLVGSGVKLDSIHVIGHSLGAHVAGNVGKYVESGKLTRITGLDPALPGFEFVTVARRLRKSDAEFVDCIHTCGGTLGIFDPICDADFYPNGGKFSQPGCSIIDFGMCSHFRSFEYFAESIHTSHKFPALYCDSITDDSRNCVESSYSMGYLIDNKARGTFYVFTNSKVPYAPIRTD